MIHHVNLNRMNYQEHRIYDRPNKRIIIKREVKNCRLCGNQLDVEHDKYCEECEAEMMYEMRLNKTNSKR